MIRYALILLLGVQLSSGHAASAPQPEGGVRVSSNPHWLEYRGRPILPIGDSVTQGWMVLGTNFDHHAYLDALASRGMNAVLLWSYAATSAALQREDRRVGYDSPKVWPWQGSPDDASFDLLQFNPAYFARLHEFVKYADSKNILVIVTVQDGWPKTHFAEHPFNAALGNGPLTDRKQFVELADFENEMPTDYEPTWTWRQKNQYFQERYAAKLCDELKDCSNLIFEMFNEGEWYDREQRRLHEEHFLHFFRKRTTAPLMTNTDHVLSKNQAARTNPAVDILSFHKKPWTGHYEKFAKAFRDEPVRAIFESEPVPALGGLEPAQKGQPLTTPEIVRSTVWERALAGAGFVAQNDTSFGWDAKCGMAAHAALRDEAYDILGHAARFFNQSGVAFWQMAPHGELASSGICLAQPGVEYVVYAPKGGALTVDLSAAKDKTFTTRWYNPRTGQFHSAAEIVGGDAARKVVPPFAGDTVLHLQSDTNTAKQDR